MPRMAWYDPRSWRSSPAEQIAKQEPQQQTDSPAKTPVMGPIGTSGLKRSGGWVDEELHLKLSGRRAALVYREMSDNDPVVGAVLYVVEALLRQATWRTEPASEEARAKEAAAFFDECVSDMEHTWDELVAEVLSMLPFGWSYLEVVNKIRRGDSEDPRFKSRFTDGKVGLRKIALRAQDTLDRWEFDQEGTVVGMWQCDPYAGTSVVLIPIKRSLLFRTTSRKNNPEGRSCLRNAYRPWYFGKRLQEYEAIGIERDLVGLPVIQLPPDLMNKSATQAQKDVVNSYKALVQQIRRDEREGVVIPAEQTPDGKMTGYKLSLLTSGGRRAIDPGPAILRHEQRIAMTMLAEFLFLGTSQVGSYSLASTKTSLFTMALGGLMENISSTFNRQLIPNLMALNGYSAEEYPKVVHGDIEAPPLEEIAAFINGLVNAGVLTPDDALERKLREMAGLPEKPHEDEAQPGDPTPKPPGVKPIAEGEDEIDVEVDDGGGL